MTSSKNIFQINLVKLDFELDSSIMSALFELEHLKKLRLEGSTFPPIFFQLKNIFQMLESIWSARIEGNNTTIDEYVDSKIFSKKTNDPSEKIKEINNVELAVQYIEEHFHKGEEITHNLICELHQITVNGLRKEGDKTPGAYRKKIVHIGGSEHQPPEHLHIRDYMDGLLQFINHEDEPRFDLIKVAQAHHRFAWIHPFGNGNGRVVRLLTYAMLIKYGFRVKDGQLLNPTAVFCNDRNKYYEMLAKADKGTSQGVKAWVEYVLTGICSEMSKIDKLLDYNYLLGSILEPAIKLSKQRAYISDDEELILKMGVKKQMFKSADIKTLLKIPKPADRSYLIKKLREKNFIKTTKPNGREYYVVFKNNLLTRSLIEMLEKEDFIPVN